MPMSSSVKTILIADDDEDLRLLVEVTLESPTYTNSSPQLMDRQALEAVKQHRPDLLIIDWMMPGLNGYEVVTQLASESPDLATIPVIMLTAKDGLESQAQMASSRTCGIFSQSRLVRSN